MSDYILILKSTLTSIGNAIRTQLGTSALIDVPDMPNEILSISGGGDSELVDFIENTLTEFVNSDVTTITRQAFHGMAMNLLELPNCTSVATQAFGSNQIKVFKLPKIATVPNNLFFGASQMKLADFTLLTALNTNMFYGCSALRTLIFRKTDGIVTLPSTGIITNSGMNNSDARIYVPQALLTQYQQGTNWSVVYADNNNLFQPLEGSPYESTDYVLPTS